MPHVMIYVRQRSGRPHAPQVDRRVVLGATGPSKEVLLAAIAAVLLLITSCSSDSVGPTDPQVAADANTFSLPRQIVVSVAPYRSMEQALQDERQVDWLRDRKAARAITLAYAAKELQDHLALAGVPVSLSVSNTVPAESAIVLRVHDPAATDTLAEPVDVQVAYGALGEQGYAISPWHGQIHITANDRIGVLNGVYGFLDQLGFAWDDPYECHTPSQASLTRPVAWRKVQEVPRVKLRGFWIFGEERIPEEFAVWLARNRLNLGGRAQSSLHHKLGLKGWGGGHDLLQLEFSRPGLFEQHPEWYALVDGVRQPIAATGTYFNPAFSSADVASYFADRMIERLEGGDLQDVDILNVWPADYRLNRFDQSPAALALGNETDNLLNFYANVGARFREALADGRLSRPVALAGISYFLTMLPPSNQSVVSELEGTEYLHLFYPIERDWSGRLDTNLVDRDTTRRFLETRSAWQSVADLNYGVVDYHNLSTYAGVGLSDFPDFAANFGILTRDNLALYAYMHPLLKNPGPRRLTNRLLSRLAWMEVNAGTTEAVLQDSGEKLVQQFFDRRYGAHAAEWRAIHELMSRSVANAKEMFGINSFDWVLLQEVIWITPPYTGAQVAEFIPKFRSGGAQVLPTVDSATEFIRASFLGLDDSLRLQQQAAQRWSELLQGPVPTDVRRRMEADIAWFTATGSRYRLIAAVSDYVWARHHELDLAEPRARIAREIAFLRESPVTEDTVSAVGQRYVLDQYAALAGLQ